MRRLHFPLRYRRTPHIYLLHINRLMLCSTLIDDFGLSPLGDQSKRDLLEILEDRYDKKSTLITSQLPVDQWHAYIDEPTLADTILDRLVHNSHRVTLKGASMRKRKGANAAAVATD